MNRSHTVPSGKCREGAGCRVGCTHVSGIFMKPQRSASLDLRGHYELCKRLVGLLVLELKNVLSLCSFSQRLLERSRCAPAARTRLAWSHLVPLGKFTKSDSSESVGTSKTDMRKGKCCWKCVEFCLAEWQNNGQRFAATCYIGLQTAASMR